MASLLPLAFEVVFLRLSIAVRLGDLVRWRFYISLDRERALEKARQAVARMLVRELEDLC